MSFCVSVGSVALENAGGETPNYGKGIAAASKGTEFQKNVPQKRLPFWPRQSWVRELVLHPGQAQSWWVGAACT